MSNARTSSSPYFEDDLVTLYHGDCREVLQSLDVEAQVLLTDPPYFKVKGDEWDRQWKKADQFLDWLGDVIDQAMPLLAPSATAWVFAGPALVSRVEREVIAPRLRILNSVRWVKEAGWHQKADIPAQRRYLTPWEGVIFAEQFATDYADADYAARKDVYRPVGAYLERQRIAAGLSRADLAVHLVSAGVYRSTESATANTSLQEIGAAMISPRAHAAWVPVVPLKPLADLRAEYDTLRRQHLVRRGTYGNLRRPFALDRATGPVHDVWNFDPVKPYTGKHPCEKPLPMLRHMIETTSRPGDLILDPFAGSGSTADAARACGRRTLLIEQNEKYCEAITQRLSQGDLFGEAA